MLTIIDTLINAVNSAPNQDAFIYLSDKNEVKETITYLQLDTKARAIAAYLQQHGKSGDRIILCYLPGIEFIAAFLGCLYAGMIAVPAYPLRNNHHARRLMTILEDCRPQLILGTKESLMLMQAQPDFAACQFVYSEDITDKLASEHHKVILKENDIAFLQYTSGSTGHPKGVMVTHGNLMHNEKGITYGSGLTADKKIVSWMPVQHDLGLIGHVLQTIYIGGQAILLPPTVLAENPLAWLQALTKYKAYFSAGPNFAFGACVKRIHENELESLDLSNWGYALCAAEPVRVETLEAFKEKFKVCGFRGNMLAPGYGLAECTLFVSNTPREQEYKILTVSNKQLEQGKIALTDQDESHMLVSCGEVYLEHEVLIVDPQSRTESASNEIGEIWIKSKSVAAGYWQKERETQEIFQATLADGRGPYLRTGDLGFLQNKNLYITGRLKDLIIQNGRNIYPQDIEAVTENSHPALRPSCTAAFSIEVQGQEQIVVVAEVERTYRKIDFNPVFLAIRQALNNALEVTPYSIQLLAPTKALRTTSGKIQRRATRELYLAGKLETLASDNLSVAQLEVNELSKDQIEQDISSLLAKILAVEAVDKNLSFSSLGGTSLDAALFQEQLQKYVGANLELSPSIAFDYPTIASLAAFLYEKLSGKSEVLSPTAILTAMQEPIAIIGMACRFPGKANSPEEFWQLLQQGQDAVTLIPTDRWNIADYYDATGENNDRTAIRHGAFIEDIDLFDAGFFNISPREAESMDPQQRILLETVWHALESAGIEPSTLKNTAASVFVGATNHEYENLLLKLNEHNSYIATGNNLSVLAGRVAYTLGIQGPCLALDTACSSSLVTIHEACNSLILGETNLAIVGAVNALLSPDVFINLARANMLAVDGHCKVFADDADGYVRGEGCGVILLKRLSEAQKNHDNILAVIKGIAINQDGASSGLTVPNGVAQEKLLRQALMQADLQPADIDYLEAHGTGTKLGDPMETHAISEVYHNSHTQEKPLILGSVKANIGHLEGAAGIAGVIKVILSLKNEIIPKQLHVQKINPKIKLSAIPGEIPQEIISWKKSTRVRRAGISSFGFSGTNAHIILEEAPTQNNVREPLPLTQFNRQRYWPKALDEQKRYSYALPKNWFYGKDLELQPLLLNGQALPNYHYLLLIDEASDKDLIKTLEQEFSKRKIQLNKVSVSELDTYLSEHKDCCIIDLASETYLNPTVDLDVCLHETLNLVSRYQNWLKFAEHIQRWVIIKHLSPNNIYQHALLNIMQIINTEYSIRAVYIELGTAANITSLTDEIGLGKEPYVQLNKERLIERIIPKDLTLEFKPALEPFGEDKEGYYLITGGLGGLGFELAKMLLEVGIKNLVLCSRTPPNLAKQQEIATLADDFSANIVHHALDISDRAALKNLVDSLPLLTGIFHLAGYAVNEPFEEYTAKQLENILRPKLAAWTLHELTAQMPIKYFVLFSSISSLCGSNRLGAYVLANGYLDSLAILRKQQDLPITHVQWGPWQDAGMAASTQLDQSNFIAIDSGMQFTRQLLSQQEVTELGVVSPQYLAFMLSFHNHLPDYLQEELALENKSVVKTNFIQEYYNNNPDMRYSMLLNWVQNILRDVLKFKKNQDLDLHKGFFEMGMDSLMAVEVYNQIYKAFGDALPVRPTLVFDYPSITKLSDYLYSILEKQTQQIVIREENYQHEPIAIIGLEARFPGAENIEHFWKELIEGKDAIQMVTSRWDPKQYPYKAGFIEGIDLFDANFFNISSREAEQMDPQQRILLETCWHAIETAGIDPLTLKDTDTGVFLGISHSDYQQLLEDTNTIDFYEATGNALNAAAGRLAYILGLQGPALAIDTACSSSLVALHEACRSLEQQECHMAIAAGVNSLLTPKGFAILDQGNMLAKDGYCKTFDKDADGYVRGEGCGVVILKRLSDAQRDKDKIYAVIKGSAVNQDGASSGLTVPNGIAQEKVLAKALANAKIEPHEVDYIEAHGTGTHLGDPIEIGAIQTIYGQKRQHPLIISTVKTNIGHLESAAGIAGVIKTILALQHEMIPPHLHFKEINPAIHLADIPAQIPLQAQPWQRQSRKIRYAGVSSFGFSGTNAHVILAEAPQQDETELRTSLPKTEFNRQHYWVKRSQFEKSIPNAFNFNINPATHPLLQHQVEIPGSEDLYFESIIEQNYPEFVGDHLIYGYIVLAGANYISAALSIAKDTLHASACKLTKVEFIEAFVIAKASMLSVKVMKEENNLWKLEFYSKGKDESPRLRARMDLELLMDFEEKISLSEKEKTFVTHTTHSGEWFFKQAEELSLSLGPRFDWLEEAYVHGEKILTRLRAPEEPTETKNYVLYPGLLDSCFRSAMALVKQNDVLRIPFSIDSITFDLKAAIPHWVFGEIANVQLGKAHEKFSEIPAEVAANFLLFDAQGQLVASIENFATHSATKLALERVLFRQEINKDLYYTMAWKKLNLSENVKNDTDIIYYDARFSDEQQISLEPAIKLLNFIKELIQSNTPISHLFIFTQQAYSRYGEAINLNQGLLNGLIKTAIIENPSLNICQVDVDKDTEISSLTEKLKTIDKEQIVCYRNDKWDTQRILPHQFIASPENIIVNPDASYLITGGLGGIGLELAQYLGGLGVKRIVLAGRNNPEENAKKIIEELKERGVDVVVTKCDVSHRAEVENLIQASSIDYPLKGVFHAAGTIHDAPLIKQDLSTFSDTFAAKACGAWNLHEATKELDLDYFVLFSSLASLNGSAGQSNYATANSFLDTLAVYRQQNGLAAQSINWGPWRDVGMAKDLVILHERQGLKPLSNQEALSSVSYALTLPEPQVGIINADWNLVSKNLPVQPSWLDDLVDKQADSYFLSTLQSASAQVRETLLKQAILRELTKVLGPMQDFDENKGFFEMGMDSLLSLELGNRLQSLLQCRIPNVAIINYNTVAQLAHYLLADILQFDNNNLASSLAYTPLQLFNSHGDKEPLFCLHGIDGRGDVFLDMARKLNIDRPIYAFQGMESTLNLDFKLDSITERASFYIQYLQQVQPHGPYYLLGWSMGAALAFEISQQLQEKGEKIAQLIIIDGIISEKASIPKKNFDTAIKVYLITQGVGYDSSILNQTIAVSEKTLLKFIQDKLVPLVNKDAKEIEQELHIINHNFRQLCAYTMPKLNMDIQIFYPEKKLPYLASQLVDGRVEFWHQLSTGAVKQFMVDGDHFTMLKETYNVKLITYLEELLT